MFTVPAFGLAPVPYWYTTLKQELYLPLRRRGIRLSSLIDDTAVFANGGSQGAALSLCLVELMTSLGFHLHPTKCVLQPTQQLRYLGLMVDTEQMVFRVPDDKLGEFLEEVGVTHAGGLWAAAGPLRLRVPPIPTPVGQCGRALSLRSCWHVCRQRRPCRSAR